MIKLHTKAYSIAICDDDQKLCSEIENFIIQYGKTLSVSIVTEVFYSGEEFFSYLKEKCAYDIVFLDIEMEAMSGIDTGLAIREELRNNDIQIVYISSHEEYALELFKIQPMDFLIKPLTQKMIIGAVEKYIHKFDKNKALHFKINHNVYCIHINNILYFSSDDRVVNIHLTDGSVKTYFGALRSIEGDLKKHNFIRCQRSFIVNLEKVKKFSKDTLHMINDDIIPISRMKKRELLDILKIFILNNDSGGNTK